VRSTGGGATYVDRFDGVAPNVRSASVAGDVTLKVWSDEAACGASVSGNSQWTISSDVALRYGITTLRNDCANGSGNWSIFSAGTISRGCAGATQIPPYLAYPCGSYGDLGLRAEVWHRPGI
jgi:hypothetical protein